MPIERLQKTSNKISKKENLLADVKEEEKNKHKYSLLTNILRKTRFLRQTKHQLRHDTNEKIIFEFQGIRWNLSMLRITCKLTKRTKTEKLKNILK